MANNPKKVKDPTEVALSAIQEALNISDAPADRRRARFGPRRAQRLPAVGAGIDDDGFDTRPSATGRSLSRSRSRAPSAAPPMTTAKPSDRSCRRFRRAAPPATSTPSPRCLPASGFSAAPLLTFSFLPALQASIGQGPAARWCWPASPRCSLRRYCCSTSWRALPGAARNCA